MSFHRFSAGAALGILLMSAPAFAAENVAVQLVGERGGQMAIKLDKSEVPAGEVTFQVENVAKNTPHEMIVVKLDSAGQEITVDPSTNKADEKQLDSLGEVSGLKAGKSGTLTVTLKPGAYKLICNLKGHIMAGMIAPFTVTG